MDRLPHFKTIANSKSNVDAFVLALNKIVDRINDLSGLAGGVAEEEGAAVEKKQIRSGERKTRSAGETVRAANLTGGHLGIYNAVRLESAPNGDLEPIDLLNNFHNADSVMLARTPGDEEAVFAITLTPSADKEVFAAKLTGVVGVMVDVEDVDHEYATTVSGQTDALVSSNSGYAKLLTKPAETGKQLCIVLLGVGTAVEREEILGGIVMESFGPGEDGRIAIYGKTYPKEDKDGNPIEPVYDIVVCDELAGLGKENPETIVRGTVLTDLRGSYRREKKKPETDETEEDGGEDEKPETERYYVAMNTEGVYTGILADDIMGPDKETTIQISDIPIADEETETEEESDDEGEEEPEPEPEPKRHTITVHSYYLGAYQKIEAGTGVMVYRQKTENGLRLCIVKSRSVITDTETETEEETP